MEQAQVWEQELALVRAQAWEDWEEVPETVADLQREWAEVRAQALDLAAALLAVARAEVPEEYLRQSLPLEVAGLLALEYDPWWIRREAEKAALEAAVEKVHREALASRQQAPAAGG